ncbi:hypothetical protein ORJ04_05930 [Rheinheimera baltica]|uniref:Uncharacterized protein n=1 Tax=Rheinheimera baltica TaxID=67576 RepID=A0ABT9HWK7_9GAMM|nr:hypothetical protein [Rheinheimera baltica]MDP5135486.1 hypothetical protein [Rheinheimera baltica]
MSDINLIKTVLFNAVDLTEALARLTELGIEFRACSFTDNGYHVTGHDITFWPTTSLRCPLAVCINGNLFDYDDRRSFLAGQCETVETTVPAASPDTTGQRPYTCPHCKKSLDDTSGCNIHKPSTESVDKKNVQFFKPRLELAVLRSVLNIERRLRLGKAKGLSS